MLPVQNELASLASHASAPRSSSGRAMRPSGFAAVHLSAIAGSSRNDVRLSPRAQGSKEDEFFDDDLKTEPMVATSHDGPCVDEARTD